METEGRRADSARGTGGLMDEMGPPAHPLESWLVS